MQYNLTPLLNVEQMHRSLYPLRALRDEFGLTVEVGDAGRRQRRLLALRRPARRARRLVLHRGRQPDPRRAAEAVPRRLLVGGAERQEGARLERLPLSLRPQPGRARQLGSRRPAAAALGRAARGRPDLPVRLPLLRIDPSGARRQRPAGSAHARFRQALERARTDPYRSSSSPRPSSAGCFATATPTPSARSAATGPTTGPTASASSAYEIGVNRATHEIVGMAESDRGLAAEQGRAAHWDRGARRRHLREHDALRRAHLGRLFLGRGAGLAVHAGAMEPQGRLSPTRRRWKAHDQLAARRHALADAARHAGPGGHLQPRRPQARGGVQALGHRRGAGHQYAALGAKGDRRGARAARRRRAGRHARHASSTAAAAGAAARPIPPVRRVAGTVPAMGYAFLPIASTATPPISRRRRRHDREPPLSRHGRPEDRRPRSNSSTRTSATISPASYQGWRPGQYVYETVDSRRRPPRHRQPRLLASRTSSSATRTRRGSARRATKVDRRRADDRRGPRLDRGRRSRRRASSARRVIYALDAGTKALIVDWMLDKLAQPRRRGGVHRLPVQPRGRELHARPQRHPGRAERGPARWRGQGLVSGAALGRCQRRQARRDARRRSMRRWSISAASPPASGRGRWSPRARRSCRGRSTITGWSTSRRARTGEIPLRYRLTTHDGAVDASRGSPFRRRGRSCRRSSCATSRRPAARQRSVLQRRSPAPVLVTAKPGEDDGWVALRLQNLSRSSKTRDHHLRQGADAAAARRSDRASGQDASRSTAASSPSTLDPLAVATVLVRFARVSTVDGVRSSRAGGQPRAMNRETERHGSGGMTETKERTP